MKITIKNINKEIYSLEIDSSKTVLELKNLIHEKYNQNPAWQTLIYSGKILEDKNTLEVYKIDEKGYIVMMIKKPRETPAASTTTPSETTSTPTTTSTSTTSTSTPPTTTTSAPTTTTSAPTTSSTTPATPNPTPTTTSTPGTSTSTPSTNTTSPSQNTTSSTDFASGAQLEATIKNLMDMGQFTREKVIRALRVCFNNADRAAELLFSGEEIPESTADDEEDDNMDAGDVEHPSGGDNPFESLRNHPYFPVLRQAIAQDPSIIPNLLQQLAQTNPDLVRQISERPNDFIRIFQEDAAGGNGSGGNPPGQFTIQVTREENEAIERLQQLTGLEKQVVIEAYFACDKNEELTASYLFDNLDNE